MEKERLEEAAEKQWGNVHRTDVLGFIEGAKWQAERSYSEEEVLNLLYERESELNAHNSIFDYQDANEWFEQFKKK